MEDVTTTALPPVPETWRLLERAIVELGARSAAADRLELIWAAYESAGGRRLGRPVGPQEREAVVRWLRSKDDSGDWPSFFAKELFLRPLLHKTMAEKASTITQISCPLHNPDDAPGGLRVFPIGIPPWSAQSAPDRSTIRQAVSDALKSQQRDPLVGWHGNEPLCLTITALVPSTGRRKDTDNLVKGLLDALQGYLYGNDGQVDCLNVRRVPYAGTTGCYFVTAGPILPWDSDVVCDDGRAPHLLFGLVPWPTTKCP